MPPTKRANQQDNAWKQADFSNVPLDEKAKEHFKGWFKENVEAIDEMVSSFAYQGYKFSLSYDSSNRCFIATLTQWSDGSVNRGKCLSSRSSEWTEAIMLCVYKTEILCPGGKWPEKVSQSNWG